MIYLNTIIKWSTSVCLVSAMIVISGNFASAQKAQLIDRNGEILQTTLQEEGRSVAEQDSNALVALYHSTNGEEWNDNSGWLVEMVEFWHGVAEVSEIEISTGVFEWRVTRINLVSNLLVGEIPPEVGLLDKVTHFFIHQNQIIGNIPTAVEDMTELQQINVGNNFMMTGRPPWEELVTLPNLTHLRGPWNRFNGEIPAIVGNFPRLRVFQFQGSPFSGDMPVELSQIETLEQIFLGHTFLTGPIPDEYANLSELNFFMNMYSPFLEAAPLPEFFQQWENLTNIRMFASNRTGPIPAWLAEMPNLNTIWLGGGNDQLTGEIPDLTFLEGLTNLAIHDSNITGPIPDWIGQMPALSTLYLMGINVSGPIPESLAQAPSLSWLYLKNLPNLVGPLPDLRNLNLTRLRIMNLGFDIGPIPEWLETQTAMTQLRLMDVGLEGQIPESWGDMPNLQWLKVEGNPGLTGELPSWVTNGNVVLKEIRLGGTNIDIGGQIPEWICEMEQLEHLRLNDMGLTGTIPDCIGNMPLLGALGDVGRAGWIPHGLSLANNQLTGEIPASFGNLQFLNGFDLSNNQLSGEIPPELFEAGRVGAGMTMQIIDLSGNPGLTGPIPLTITEYNTDLLRRLHLNDTGLCEPVDAGFEDWMTMMLEAEGFPMEVIGVDMSRSIKRTATKCDGTTNVEPELHAYSFRLNQNYPNPFNPSTTISYAVPSEAHVELIVYNVIGQRVATLVSETVNAGQHEVNFDASNLSSGTYIYRLVAGDRNLTQSMMLLK